MTATARKDVHANQIPNGPVSPTAPPGQTARRTAGAAPGERQAASAGPGAAAVRPAAPNRNAGDLARGTAEARMRLTGRGGVLAVFAISFMGLLGASLSHAGMLAGLSYVVACILATSLARRGHLLPIVVTAPMLFGGAVVCVQAVTATGGVLSVAGGTLVTLGNVAPWLFAGTASATIIALARGLAGELRELRASLRGEGHDS